MAPLPDTMLAETAAAAPKSTAMVYTVPLTAWKPDTLPPTTTTSDGNTDVTDELNVAVTTTDVALVVLPDDRPSPHDKDAPVWYVSSTATPPSLAAFPGAMDPLLADIHTDTERIAVSSLERMVDLTMAVVEQARSA